MSSFFLKLFFLFWLAATLIGMVLVTTLTPLLRSGIGGPERHALDIYGRAAVHILETQGAHALAEAAAEWKRETGISTRLVGIDTQTLPGDRVPKEPDQLLALAQQMEGVPIPATANSLEVRHLVGAAGGGYLLVSEFPRRSFPSFIRHPRSMLFPLVINFFVAGIVCGWLAWYLTKPLRRLRQASQRLAAGDLGARSGLEASKGKDELAQLGRDFDHMAGRIETLVTAQKALLRDISHELRSPLARLNVALEMVRHLAGDTARGSLDRIARETERMNDLIGDILTLCRSEADREGMYPVSIDLAAFVREVASDADFEARSRGCSVLVETVPCTITGSPELLRRAIENALRNAVRYTREGTQVEVALRSKPKEEYASIRIRDRGPGVPAEDLEKIFQPFYRVATARDRQSGGTGLGLAIVDRAVRIQGGEVRAANADEGGLIIEMRLPIRTNGR